MNIGDEYVVDISSIAHGGHFVARFEGRVIFVRHAIPGETVRVRITEISKSFARGDCVDVIKASPDRVVPMCKYANPQGCGGCDFQHIAPAAQRLLKAEVIKEQFARLAKMKVEVVVEEVPPSFGWRTRMEFTSSVAGKVAMYKSRSNDLIELDECKIAHPAIEISKLNEKKAPSGRKIDVAVDSNLKVHTSIEGRENLNLISQSVKNFTFTISPTSFWQSHIAAPELLLDAVLEYSDIKPGDHVYDLYSGVGLFASGAAEVIGANGRITMIEESESAVVDARRNFAQFANVEIIEGKVEHSLKRFVQGDIVILDPPRSGAGAKVIEQIAALEPRTIVYVACDPAALARDCATLLALNYELAGLRAFDLFPMTQHIESVARFIRKP